MLEIEELHIQAENAIKWIKDYVTNSGAKGVVVGNSGGKDSAVVIAMSVKALGANRVLAVCMPCHSIESDGEDARLVASTFGVKMLDIDLDDAYDVLENKINSVLNIELSQVLNNESKINIKPRLRMTTLYAIAQTMNYLVIGTGNLCEAMVGYTTKWGDNSYDFNPIGNFTVEEVLEIGAYLGVPKKILMKAPSDGLGMQTDEEKMGVKYKQISDMIEFGDTDIDSKEKIIKLCKCSKHKRENTPVYRFKRKNYLLLY